MLPADRGPQIVASTGFFLVFAWICVSLRVYVRSVVLKCFGIDDWLVVLAMLFFTAASTLIFVGAVYGVGRHRDVLPVAHYEIAMELWYFNEMVYGATILFTKISVAFYLKRIATQKMHLLMINTAVGASALFSVFFLFYLMFQCQPINYFWTKYGDGVGSCRASSQTGAAIYAFSGVNAFVDFTVALVPWLVVRDLRMNFRTKISVVIILCLGSMASVATVIRIPYLHNLTQGDDFLWSTADVTIWSAVEMGLGIAACSMATLKPLFVTFFQWTSTSYNNSRSKFTDLERDGGKSTDGSKYLSKFKLFKKKESEARELNILNKTTLVTVVETKKPHKSGPEDNNAGSGGGWNHNETGASTENLSSSPEWATSGIMKTMRVDIDTKARSIREAL